MFYNLDSKLDAPLLIGTVTSLSWTFVKLTNNFNVFQDVELIYYVKEELECKDKEMFLVVTSEIEKEQSWHHDQVNQVNNIQERDAEILQLRDIVSDFNVLNPICNKGESLINNSNYK